MTVIVRDIDRGWKQIVKETTRSAAVRVGVQQDTPGHGNDGATMAEVAFYNEFGTRRIPERSFIRSAIDERDGYRVLVARLVRGITGKAITLRQALHVLGQQAQTDIQAKISSNVPPPNAPTTIARKGSSKTLIDTGAMRAAIRYRVEGA